MTKKKKILVTGGAGYIGSHTIIALHETNLYDVVSVDNYSNSSPDTYRRIESISGYTTTAISADLSSLAETEAIFAAHPDIYGVIHFAAFKSVPESVLHPGMYYRNNINSLLNVLSVGEKNGMRNVIFSSSCSVYGNISTLPVNENTAFGKVESPYAFTKIVGENIMRDTIAVSKTLHGISLRYFNPVGAHESGKLGELPNQRPNNLVPVITQTAIGKIKSMQVFGSDYPTRDGTCVRDYIHVCDIAEAHVLALGLLDKPEQPAYDIFNLGTGTGVTVLEAIHAFEKTSGRKLNFELTARRAGDVEAIYSDSSKALNQLGWKTKRNLDEMMSTAWKWELHLAGQNV
ncbi:MAG TPA: UDP-glucose 4-epimerase GalE [Bacteroidia bacterium]|nr:UDP-glucose 4-epimerase GalE [Bacteroidia bacterium]